MNGCVMLSKMAKQFLFFVKTGIFYEFSKSGLSAPRPGERKTGTSDVKPGHYQQSEKAEYLKKKALIQLALVKSIDISSVIASNEFNLDSSSDSEVSEIEDKFGFIKRVDKG